MSFVFELQDKKYWSQANPSISNHGLYILNNMITNSTQFKESIILNKWAKIFAFIDVFNLYHGSVSKSVKFYYNPVYGKFEPVFFDGHHGAGEFRDFFTD